MGKQPRFYIKKLAQPHNHKMPGKGDDIENDTRTIARRAVEAEFRKKKKHKRYDSSDDDNDDNDNDDGNDKGKDRTINKNNNKQKSVVDKKQQAPRRAVWEVKYRDRAKERREGKGITEQDEGGITSSHTKKNPADKYSLMDDVLDEEQQQGGGEEEEQNNGTMRQPIRGLDRSVLEKRDATTGREETTPYVRTRQEALHWLATCRVSSLQSDLGKEILPILRHQYATEPVAMEKPSYAGLAVQRSTILFSTAVAHPVLSDPWHVPREEDIIGSNRDGDHNGIPKLSAIQDINILERIQKVLERQKMMEENADQARNMNDNPTTTEQPNARQTKTVSQKEESDEDIFQIDDDDDDDDDNNDVNDNGNNRELLTTKEFSSNQEPVEKPRRTFFFHPPPPTETATASMSVGSATTATATVTATLSPPAATARLERLSALDGDYGVEYDDRLEEEDDTGAKKKKKKLKRKRKNKDEDDSD